MASGHIHVRGERDESARNRFSLTQGHDTTSAGIEWTIYELARHPQYQKQCQEEIDAILGDDMSAWPSLEQLPEFRFLDQCIKGLTFRSFAYGIPFLRGWPPALCRAVHRTLLGQTAQIGYNIR